MLYVTLFFYSNTVEILHDIFQVARCAENLCIFLYETLKKKLQKFFNVLHEITQKMLKLTNKREKRKEIYLRQVRNIYKSQEH